MGVIKDMVKRVPGVYALVDGARKNKMYRLHDNLYKEIDIDNMPLFGRIAIETVNRCNGKCSFCPVNVHEEQRPYAKMSTELFEKIINNLVDLKYKGEYVLLSNNEPFLDDRIIDFYKYAKQKLPDCYADIWTNGTLMTLEKFLAIIPWLDKVIIDNYNDNKELNPNTKIIYEYIQEHDELKEKVIISMRLENEVLTSRGGAAPNKKNINHINAKCNQIFTHVTVRPDGKISLCCSDALGKWTLGDLKHQTLEEMWYGEQYKEIRRIMKNVGRGGLELCNHCDVFHDWHEFNGEKLYGSF